MKGVFALALVLLLAAAAGAAEQAVTFESGGEQASGLLVTPEGKGPFPAWARTTAFLAKHLGR